MKFFRNHSWLFALCITGCVCLCSRSLAADDSGITDTPGVADLRAKPVSTNILLTWPSDPQESFVVVWRSNANYQAKWIILTNQLLAAPDSYQTKFLDRGGFVRPHQHISGTNLAKLYAVYVIPDFWFDMQGVTLCGGSKVPGEDFLPFYYDTGGMYTPEQNVGLMVDGREAGWGPIHVERVNFGTIENPRWIHTWGFWFDIDLLRNGEHTLQLRSMVPLNNFIGKWTQDIFLTNKPVQVRILTNGKGTNLPSWWDRRLGHNFHVPQNADEYGKKFLQPDWNPPAVKIPSRPFDLRPVATRPKSSSMILDLGETSHYVKVTPEYSQAVLAALLPYFSDTARRLDLPVPQPITKADIARFHVLPFRELAASILLKDGWVFNYRSDGHGIEFYSPHSYYSLQDPAKIPDYYGHVKWSQKEAVQLARDTLKKLGVRLKNVYADLEPQVIPPVKIGTNTVPRYEIAWIDPYGGKTVNFEINAETGNIEQMILLDRISWHPPLKLRAIPTFTPPDWPSTNPEYARRLIPIMFVAIDNYAQKLSLPIPRPLTTNNVARVRITDNGGWPDCDVILTNGWRFVYRHTMVNGYFSPNALMTDNHFHALQLKNLEGQWKLTTNQAIELVKITLAKLNYPTNNFHMDFAPEIHCPPGVFRQSVPRYALEWDYYSDAAHEVLQSMIEAEVNADSGRLESLYYDDKAYWDSRPPIDVPISSGKYPNFPQ